MRDTRRRRARRRRHHCRHRQRRRRRRRARPGRPGVGRRVRRRLGRAAAPAGQQRRRDGDPGARAHPRGLGAAVRHEPPRPLRARRSACTTRSPPTATRGSCRSAPAGHLRSPVVFDDINFGFRPYDPLLAYGQSKTANVLFAVEATRRWAGDGITANALMPGGIATNLQRHVDPDYMERAASSVGRADPLQDGRAGRRDERPARGLAAARGHRRPLLRGLQRGRDAAQAARGRSRRRRRRLVRAGPGHRSSGCGTCRWK